MRRLLCGVLVAAASMVFAPSAMAALGLQSFEVSATNPTTEPSQIGFPDVQAGSHPDLTTSFVLSPEVPVAEGSLKDVRVELPPGFVGNPEATPRCTCLLYTSSLFGLTARGSTLIVPRGETSPSRGVGSGSPALSARNHSPPFAPGAKYRG